MQITITIPDAVVAAFLARVGWTAETGDPVEAAQYVSAAKEFEAGRGDDPGEYDPRTAQEMIEREILHHFASHALAEVRDTEGSAGVEAKRSDADFASVFDRGVWKRARR